VKSDKKVPAKASSEKTCFAMFQLRLTEYVEGMSTDMHCALDRHCHHGTPLSSISGGFMYRGVRSTRASNNLKRSISDQAVLKKIAINMLDIPMEHVKMIDALLLEIDGFQRTGVPIRSCLSRSSLLVDSISQKLQLKRLLEITMACLDCELQTMSTLQYNLLQTVLLEEADLKIHCETVRHSIDSIS
jgi:hypothetical protein